jgi:phage regulator Rha-like protein
MGKNAILIEKFILKIRKQMVMLDSDLAALYGVETKVLLQSVKRNIKRFPIDFMFQLTVEEYQRLRSQIVTSKQRGGRRYAPYVFTEQGVAMLSSVLSSQKAINVNIEIIRTFVKLRKILSTNRELAERLNSLEQKYLEHDEQFQMVFDAIRQLMEPPKSKRRSIGFHIEKTGPAG